MAHESTMIGQPAATRPTHAVIAGDKAVLLSSEEDARRRARAEAMSGHRAYVAVLVAEYSTTVEQKELLEKIDKEA